MTDASPTIKRRTRRTQSGSDSRARLLRSGLELLTEQGFGATGIDDVLRRAEVPKGSFYHYFPSKAEFALVLIGEYNNYFRHRLRTILDDSSLTGAARIASLVDNIAVTMRHHDFRRGCLIGNFSQEFGGSDEVIRQRLEAVFREWEHLLAGCIEEGQSDGSIAPHVDPAEAAAFFWTGWEGAVMRSKIALGPEPLHRFGRGFLDMVAFDRGHR